VTRDNKEQAQKEKPVVYVLHGDDQLAIQQHLDQMKAGLGEEDIFEANLVRFDCRLAGEEEIHTAAMTLPFLASRRIVILDNPLAKLDAAKENETILKARQRFLTMLDHLPGSTALVLVLEDHHQGKKGWAVLKKGHWLWQWIASAGARVHYQPCPLPDQKDMPGWIMRKAVEQKGAFTKSAAATLAEMVGSDTLLARQEIEKLLMYVDFLRPVDAADVALLCSGGSGDVFEMVDAIGRKNSPLALRQLHTLLEHNEPQGLFFMIVRQFRLLIQLRESIDDGGDLEDASREFQRWLPLEELKRQAARFPMAELEAIYQQLVEMDEAVKTSRVTSPVLALDTLIARICGEQQAN